jgi:hypothetical protein
MLFWDRPWYEAVVFKLSLCRLVSHTDLPYIVTPKMWANGFATFQSFTQCQTSGHIKRHAANSRALTKYPQAHVVSEMDHARFGVCLTVRYQVVFASCSDFQGSGGVIIGGGEFLGAMSSVRKHWNFACLILTKHTIRPSSRHLVSSMLALTTLRLNCY